MYLGLKCPLDSLAGSGGFAAIAMQCIWDGHWRKNLNVYEELSRSFERWVKRFMNSVSQEGSCDGKDFRAGIP